MLVRSFFQGPGYLTFCSLMAWEANPESLGGGESGNQGTEGQQDVGDGSQGQESGYSSFVQELLKDAPKEHVSIMEPYIKKFDAGVTRRFQDLKNQYKHYEPLGWDEETTQQMSEVYRVLNEEPERLYEALKEQLELEEEAQKPGSQVGESGPEFQGLPPEITAQIEQQQQVLAALAQWVMDQDQKSTETVEDQEFDGYLDLLKKEYGEFDEEYVVTQIANGMDGEAAVKAWNDKVQGWLQKVNASTEHLPGAVLSSAGGGSVPQGESQNLGQIPDKDIRALIANVIGQTNQAGM
jgi:hypothetical protein